MVCLFVVPALGEIKEEYVANAVINVANSCGG